MLLFLWLALFGGGGRGGATFSPRAITHPLAHCKNVRRLGKSVVVFHLFEKLRYSNERTTKFESLCQE